MTITPSGMVSRDERTRQPYDLGCARTGIPDADAKFRRVMSERVTNTGYGRGEVMSERGERTTGADPRADLARELGGAVAVCNLLSDREAADLLTLFRSAQQAETTTLAAAVDGMVSALPRPFRAITKRIMFGDLV